MTETRPQITAGIDVGKSHLELSINAGPTQTYPNDPEGIAALTLELARQPEPIALAVHEPTGGYERPLAEALAAAGLLTRRVNANRVRRLRPGLRAAQAKTDRLDSQVLSRYAAAFDLPPNPSPETGDAGLRAQLKDLLPRREQLAAQPPAGKSRLDKRQSDEARASAERHITWLDEEIARLEKAYRSLLQSSPALSAHLFGAHCVGLLTTGACCKAARRYRMRRRCIRACRQITLAQSAKAHIWQIARYDAAFLA